MAPPASWWTAWSTTSRSGEPEIDNPGYDRKRGWTQADMQLFSDERALSRAPPEKVCQLVTDWFAAQLDIKDQDIQLRLLVDSLKPVVAG